MNLEDLIADLIAEGYTPTEAAKVAAATLRAQEKRGGAIARSEQDLSFPASPQNDGRIAVDYGHESPQEAKERWMEQEMRDPQGVFSGGMSAGGLFGDGAIATETYDPAAVNRTMAMEERVQNQRVQVEMLRTMQDMQRRLDAPPEPRRRLPRPPSFSRLLGKKKR